MNFKGIFTWKTLGLFFAVLLFSFGSYALSVLWEPILAGLSRDSVSFSSREWILLFAGLLTYAIVAAIGAKLLANTTSKECNCCKYVPIVPSTEEPSKNE